MMNCLSAILHFLLEELFVVLHLGTQEQMSVSAVWPIKDIPLRLKNEIKVVRLTLGL